MTLPFVGHPCGAPSKKEAKNKLDQIQSAYRFLIGDNMPFGKRAIIQLEHGGQNLSKEHYETVTYWYGLPVPSLIKTDEINIGDATSEKVHNYSSPEASEVEKINSRCEYGIDVFPENPWSLNKDENPGYSKKIGQIIVPKKEKYGRHTRGTSIFEVSITKNNLGVLLRRTLDYSFPNQQAVIYVKSASGKHENWQRAGIWYLAGSNTAFYSNPRGELEKRQYKTQTSNRRFRNDEFLIPSRLTKNKNRIQVKIKFVPDSQQLFPGFPFPKRSAWSELSYMVYSYQIPKKYTAL